MLTCLASIASAAGGGFYYSSHLWTKTETHSRCLSLLPTQHSIQTQVICFWNFDAGGSMFQMHFGIEEAHSLITNLKSSPPV